MKCPNCKRVLLKARSTEPTIAFRNSILLFNTATDELIIKCPGCGAMVEPSQELVGLLTKAVVVALRKSGGKNRYGTDKHQSEDRQKRVLSV